MIPEFWFDYPGRLEFNQKFGNNGGGWFWVVQKRGLSLFTICPFSFEFWGFENLGLPPEQNIIGGKFGLDPLFNVEVNGKIVDNNQDYLHGLPF